MRLRQFLQNMKQMSKEESFYPESKKKEGLMVTILLEMK